MSAPARLPEPAPLDPALLAVIEALARAQARRDYAAQTAEQTDARRPLRPL